MYNLILSTLSTLALLMHPLSLSAQNSVSLLPNMDGSAGDKVVVSVNMYDDGIVVISDANLRAVIEKGLGKASGEPITGEEMVTLTRLNAPNKNIRDLTGLESASGLTMLILGGEVENGKPVNSNTISDVSALSGLTNLRVLDLGFNAISDVSPLFDMTSLIWLSLSSNNISDVSALSELTSLQRLFLDKNTISDVSALSSLTSLDRLFLDNNSIPDVSALSSLTSLTWLYLHNNRISDVSVLSELTSLVWLSLSSNNISDVAPLVANTGLGEGANIDVRNNPLSTTSINKHIPALKDKGVDVHFRVRKPAKKRKNKT